MQAAAGGNGEMINISQCGSDFYRPLLIKTVTSFRRFMVAVIICFMIFCLL